MKAQCAPPTSLLQSSVIQFTKQWRSHMNCSCAQPTFSTFYMLHFFFCQVLWFLLTLTQLLSKGKRHNNSVMCNRVRFQEDKIMVNVWFFLHMKQKNTGKKNWKQHQYCLTFSHFPSFSSFLFCDRKGVWKAIVFHTEKPHRNTYKLPSPILLY